MKITITNDKKESGENVFYVPSMLFASIVATLQEYGCLKRDAELQRAADRSAIELLAVIRNAGEVEMDDFSEEFWQEVDAVLKTAGGD